MSFRWMTIFLDIPAPAASRSAWSSGTRRRPCRRRGRRTHPAGRVDTLCLDVAAGDFERECAFWAELTGQQVRPARIAGFSYLTRPAGWPARLLARRPQWTVLADPAGREYCLVDREPG